MNNYRISNRQYKVFLILLKYAPCLLAVLTFFKVILRFIGVESSAIYGIIDPSLFTVLGIMYLSLLFKYCWVHRVGLYYIILIDIYNLFGNFFRNVMELNVHPYFIGLLLSTFTLLIYLLFGYDKSNKKFIRQNS
jgi:hypothetical protein